LTDWACALAGETGEACNLIKKLRRGDAIDTEDIGKELADVVIYADLLAARLGIDLGEAVVQKFNEVSDRYGYAGKLERVADTERPGPVDFDRLLALLGMLGVETCPDCWPMAGAGDCPRCSGRGFINIEKGPEPPRDRRTEG
jgi:hypothetical protein